MGWALTAFLWQMIEAPETHSKKHKGIRFSGEVSLGNVLIALSMVGTICTLWINFATAIAVLQAHDAEYQKVTERLTAGVQQITENNLRLTMRMDAYDERPGTAPRALARGRLQSPKQPDGE